MNYTDQDILEFIQAVKWLYDGVAVDTTGEYLEMCLVQIYTSTIKVYKKDLKRWLTGRSSGAYPILTAFLQFTPLENVPLFIHDIPEFARWRLRIAK